MQLTNPQKSSSKWLTHFGITILLIMMGLILLAGCDAISKNKLEVYESEELKIKLPILPGWEVQVDQADPSGASSLTIKNDYSGVLVTRSSIDIIFPAQEEAADIETYLNKLIDLSQGTFSTTGPVKVQQKADYQLATVPILLEQVAEMSSGSNGTLLLAIQETDAIIAVFFCSIDQLDKCEADLARSVKGFKVVKP